MNLIVAVDQNWGIGRDGEQLLYLSEDLKRFRQLTWGHPVILGRKTLATFPGGRPLPGRDNWILSRDIHRQVPGAKVVHSIPDLLRQVPPDSFVIGGASLYHQLLPWCHQAYVTKIQTELPADRYCPNLDTQKEWTLQSLSEPLEQDGISFQYGLYVRNDPQDDVKEIPPASP